MNQPVLPTRVHRVRAFIGATFPEGGVIAPTEANNEVLFPTEQERDGFAAWQDLPSNTDWARPGGVLEERSRSPRLLQDKLGAKKSEQTAHGRHARRIPKAVRHAVWQRDGGLLVRERRRSSLRRAPLARSFIGPATSAASNPMNVRLLQVASNLFEAERVLGEDVREVRVRAQRERRPDCARSRRGIREEKARSAEGARPFVGATANDADLRVAGSLQFTPDQSRSGGGRASNLRVLVPRVHNQFEATARLATGRTRRPRRRGAAA